MRGLGAVAIMVVVAMCADAGAASAHPRYGDDEIDDEEGRPRVHDRGPYAHVDGEVVVGRAVGALAIGGRAAAASGVRLGAGHRRGRWLLGGEYVVGTFDERAAGVGALHRLGGGVRASFFTHGRQYREGGWAGWMMWAGADAGVEWLRWDRGARVRRGEVSAELGVRGIARVEDEARSRFLGVEVGVRVGLAAAPPASQLPACDDCRRRRGTDVSLLFVVGLPVGG